jgi:hypothetical protein
MQLNVSEWIPKGKHSEIVNLLPMEIVDVSGVRVVLFWGHYLAIHLVAAYTYSTRDTAPFDVFFSLVATQRDATQA